MSTTPQDRDRRDERRSDDPGSDDRDPRLDDTRDLGTDRRFDRDRDGLTDERRDRVDDRDRFDRSDRDDLDRRRDVDEGTVVERRAAVVDPRDRMEAEQASYGGVKPGAAFFGWLSATGMSVLLTALLVAAGAAVGIATGTDLEQAADDATGNPESVGAAGVIGLAVIIFVSYYCGGYVAGRMARFQGARQGVAVWVWALVIAAIVALLGFIAGSEYNVLEQLNGLPRIPVDEGTLSSAGIVTLVVALLVSLGGAILGGIAGVRYHRKVDRAGFDDTY